MTLPDDIPIVTGPAETYLNPRQRLDYESHRQELLEWLHTYGKDPAVRLLETVFDIAVSGIKPGTRDCGTVYRTDPPVVISPHWSHGWLDRSPTGPRNLDRVQEAVVDVYRDRAT